MFIEMLEGRQLCSASAPAATPALFEVNDYSFNIEQVLNIGSQTSGAS